MKGREKKVWHHECGIFNLFDFHTACSALVARTSDEASSQHSRGLLEARPSFNAKRSGASAKVFDIAKHFPPQRVYSSRYLYASPIFHLEEAFRPLEFPNSTTQN